MYVPWWKMYIYIDVYLYVSSTNMGFTEGQTVLMYNLNVFSFQIRTSAFRRILQYWSILTHVFRLSRSYMPIGFPLLRRGSFFYRCLLWMLVRSEILNSLHKITSYGRPRFLDFHLIEINLFSSELGNLLLWMSHLQNYHWRQAKRQSRRGDIK